MPAFHAGFPDEIGEDMGLQMIDFNHRKLPGDGESFGERGAYQQGTQQPGTAGERDCVYFLRGDVRFLQRLVHDRYDVLLMRPGSQFRDDSAIRFVDFLAGDDIAQHDAVFENGSRSVVAGRFYPEDYSHDLSFSVNLFQIWCNINIFVSKLKTVRV